MYQTTNNIKAAIAGGFPVMMLIYGLPSIIFGYNDDEQYLLVQNWLGKTCKLNYPIAESISDAWILKEEK